MVPYVKTDVFELVTVPQILQQGAFSVKVTYKRQQYEWVSSSDFTLEGGKTYSLTVNLVTTKSSSDTEMTITIMDK